MRTSLINLWEQDADAKLYTEYLPVLIDDLRKDLEAPALPVVIVGTGKGGREQPAFPAILTAQQRVAALPRFAGNVRYVETRDFWPPPDARAAGEAMLELLR